MAAPQAFTVLIASDGSAAAGAAIRVAARFPWPPGVRIAGIVAKDIRSDYRRSTVLTALDRSAESVAARTITRLKKHWPDATVAVSDRAPIDAITREAKRLRARVVVVGWRGYGPLRRLLTGSVSRGVVRQAPCSVLVVRRFRNQVQRIVVGVDESAHARHAIDLIASLPAPPGGQVTVVSVVDTMRVPSQVHLTRETRAIVGGEVDRINKRRILRAHKATESAVARLVAAGWNADAKIAAGAPLWELLAEVRRSRADVLVLGARGVSGLTRLLLGSVAEAALNHCPVPVLIVR